MDRWRHIASRKLNVTLPSVARGDSAGMETEHIFAGVYDESTRDYAPFLALPGALAVFRWLEPARVRRYCFGLAAWGTEHLAEWGTAVPVAPELATAMVTAELPERLLAAATRLAPAGSDRAVRPRHASIVLHPS